LGRCVDRHHGRVAAQHHGANLFPQQTNHLILFMLASFDSYITQEIYG
jgi:hypothetical protein